MECTTQGVERRSWRGFGAARETRSLELSGASSVDLAVHTPVMTRQRPLVAVKLADLAGALNSSGREPVGHRTTRNWQPYCS